MIHIVFNQADIDILKKAIELDENLRGNVVQIKDDFAAGPLAALDETEGWQARKEWWKGLLEATPYDTADGLAMVDDRLAVHQLKRALEENSQEEIWLWMGQNGHDVCGYYWLIGQLKEYQGRVFVLYMNNLPFLNEKGQIFYPSFLHQIQPKEFLKARKLCRTVTLSELEMDTDEWKRLCAENTVVRILEGGKKIVSRGADFYDKDILLGLSNDFQKGSKAMSSILARMKIQTGDVLLLARMKKLAEEGVIEITGDTSKGWKEFEVRLKKEAATIDL